MTTNSTADAPVYGFNSPEEAARARDALAVRLHGEFAVLNFPIKEGTINV